MKIVMQRVKHSGVSVEGEIKGKISGGIMALVGFCESDEEKLLLPMAEKMVNLRIFTDADDKMNLSLLDTNGELLVISQFTLYADCKKGRRPSFTGAKAPAEANELYEKFVSICETLIGKKVQTGEFGADMQVDILNDGPVTIILDSDEIVKR